MPRMEEHPFVGSLVRKTATEVGIKISTVHEIIAFQYGDAYRSSKKVLSIEVAGFGTFSVSILKMRKLLEDVKETLLRFEYELRTRVLSEKKKDCRISIIKELEDRRIYLENTIKRYEDRYKRDSPRGVEFCFCETTCRRYCGSKNENL